MSQNRLVDYLRHMLMACSDAQGFVEGMSEADFLSDKRTQQAVIMSLVIIGEVAAKVLEKFPEFAEANTQVPWRNIRGMRNRIAHGYFDINLHIVWETLESALPDLMRSLEGVRNDL